MNLRISKHRAHIDVADLRRAVQHAGIFSGHDREIRNKPMWYFVMHLFSLGRTSANELCGQLGLDPDQKL